MTPRAVPILVTAVALLIGSSLGLTKGMVLCVDAHGHLALESAHVQHAWDHHDGADHHSDEFPADAEHDELHAALEACFDTAGPTLVQRPDDAESLRPQEMPSDRSRIGSAFDGLPQRAAARLCSSPLGATARTDFVCLSTIVLIV